jgi:hypothetical protein
MADLANVFLECNSHLMLVDGGGIAQPHRHCELFIHYSYKLNGVEMAVSDMSSGCILIWKKLSVMSIVAQIFPLAQSFRMLSTLGNGCELTTMLAFSCW